MRYRDGNLEERVVEIASSVTMRLDFNYQPVLMTPVISPDSRWYTGAAPNSRSTYSISKESINGWEKDVMNMEILLTKSRSWGTVTNVNIPAMQELRQGSGVRFKALGDGKNWKISFSTSQDSWNHFEAAISTKKDRIIEVTIPFTGLRQRSGEKRIAFDKTNIVGVEFSYSSFFSSSSSIKIFDFEVLP